MEDYLGLAARRTGQRLLKCSCTVLLVCSKARQSVWKHACMTDKGWEQLGDEGNSTNAGVNPGGLSASGCFSVLILLPSSLLNHPWCKMIQVPNKGFFTFMGPLPHQRREGSVSCQCYRSEKLIIEPRVIIGLGAGRVTRFFLSFDKDMLQLQKLPKSCRLKLVFRLFKLH